VGSGGEVLAQTNPALNDANLIALGAPSPEALAFMTASLDPEANPPKPLYLRAPDATPPTRLPGQPRVAAS
jgi:tRNA threonylcarbamoyladenosine biosynthesis protein TsaB